MRWLSRVLTLCSVLVALTSARALGAVTKIACLGASTTSGDGSSPGHHFPDELGIALGPAYAVKNFGVSGTTVLKTGDNPYWTHPELMQAIAYQPDIAIFWFGGNDAKPLNWTGHMAEFLTDYDQMIRMVQAAPSHPKTYVFRTMEIHDTEGIPKIVLEQQVLPEIDQAAADTGSVLVNYHDAFIIHPEYYPDGIHPDDQGTAAIGKWMAAILTGSPDDGGVDARAAASDASDMGDGEAQADAIVFTADAATPGLASGDGAVAGEGGTSGTSSTGAAGGTGAVVNPPGATTSPSNGGGASTGSSGVSSSGGGPLSASGAGTNANNSTGCALSTSRQPRGPLGLALGLAASGLLALRRLRNRAPRLCDPCG
jgi:lysophospholipase L1-like esterase